MKREKPTNLVMAATRDDMHAELLSKIRLGRADLRYMVNISNKFISKGLPLSEAQNQLYEKIINKYRKQIRQLGGRYTNILDLPWRHGIITAHQIQQKSFLRFVNHRGEVTIELGFAFNKKWIEEIKKIKYDDVGAYLSKDEPGKMNGRSYDWKWLASEKMYRGPFNVYLFRGIYDWAKRRNIVIDPLVEEFVDKLNATGDDAAWTPRVENVQGRLYVCGITESMLPYLDKVDMDDTTPQNVEQLCKLGLKAPKFAGGINKYLEAQSVMHGVPVHSIQDIESLVSYLHRTRRKAIFCADYGRISSSVKESEVYKMLHNNFVEVSRNLDPEALIVNASNNASMLLIDKLVEQGYNTMIIASPLERIVADQNSAGRLISKVDKIIYLSLAGQT